MKYIVTPWDNFCRIFELPGRFPSGYCFGGGHPCNFQLIDWFYPTEVSQAAVPKEVWEKEVGPVKDQDVEYDHEELKKRLMPFLKEKTYVKPGRTYLFMADFGMTFLFSK